MDLITCTCYIVMSLGSQHLGDHNLNQRNPGIGVEVNHWHAGEYRNSLDRTSVYVGRDWETSGAVKAGVLAGAVSGYNRLAGSPVLPLIAPYISAEYGRVGINVALLPNPIQWNESAVALQVKIRL